MKKSGLRLLPPTPPVGSLKHSELQKVLPGGPFTCRGKVIITCLLSLLVLSLNIYAQNASIKEEYRTILTYPFSDPSPIPSMAVSSMISPFYPYFVFDGYSEKGINQQWKVISLDNDFINVTVLPEAGGKVWGAFEKSTGREFVYQNHVMKFRAIGIRGPWTSGGIEHNFGLDLGHAPWTASPVDYIVKHNDDGSVSCIVGGLDLASGTQWRVNILLPRDKAYFETSSIWYNPTPLHDAYLSWENGGFKASDDLQFFFPGYYYIGHDGAVSPWPVDKNGRDLSWYRNNNFGSSKSYHVSGYYTNWFGGYWHDSGFGFGHSAPYSDVPGKKIWIWSLARDGAIWEDLLTDTDGQYIEAQSGVKLNQANRESGYNSPFNQLSMRPGYSETKTEYWFPVLNTGGMADASRYGTLNVIHSNDSLNIYISPVCEINDSLVIGLEGRTIISAFLNLKTMQLHHGKYLLKGSANKDITVRVGNNLLSYHSDKSDIITQRPSLSGADDDYNSAAYYFRLAEDMNAMREYDNALAYYQKCLQTEPAHSGALYRTAELCYRCADYDEALRLARKILRKDTYDGSGNFMLGVTLRRMGKLNQGEEAFSIAARTMEYRSSSYLQIAGLKIQKKDFSGAVEYAKKAIDFNRYNIPAYDLLAVSYRKLNKQQQSENVLNEILELDPLDHFARFEQYLHNPADDKLSDFKSLIRNELPYETYLEVAVEYVNIGLEEEAIRVLEQSPSYPVVYYWLAYLYRNSDPAKSMTCLTKASEMSPSRVFPHRLETLPVMAWATKTDQSWKPKYYQGLIYWHIGRNDRAAELLELCGDIPDYAPFYIARGTLFRNIQSEYCHPCNDFNSAVRIDPGEWRTWHYLINFLQSEKAFQSEVENSEKAYSMFPSNPVIGTDHAKALLNAGRYSECVNILEKVKILPQEGAHEGHDIFELANLSLAVEMTEKGKYRKALDYVDDSGNWPENLGAGKPYDPDTRFQDYISAFCHEKLGERKLADKYRNQIADYSILMAGSDREPVNMLIGVYVLNGQGKQALADESMKRWKTEQDSLLKWKLSQGSSSQKAQWLLARYMNEDDRATSLEKEIVASPAENRFRLFLRFYNNLNTSKR